MSSHSSPALLFLRFFLPAALLFASCLTFTLPSLLFFLAFLVQHFTPHYEVTSENFPNAYLLSLFVYSTILIITHIVLAILVSRSAISFNTKPLEEALAIPNYQHAPWQSVKYLVAPLSVFICTLIILNSSKPHGGGRYFKLPLFRKKNNLDDLTSQTSDGSSSRHLDLDTPLSFDREVPQFQSMNKFTEHMAGRGGIFWTTIACGFTGLSYSSVLTLIFLAAFSVVVVGWAFDFPHLDPRRLGYKYIETLRFFRIFVLLYLIFITSLQNALFVNFWKSDTAKYSGLKSVLRLLGFVQLDTAEVGGWAFITGFCFAIATYVFSGIFCNALRQVAIVRNESLLEEHDSERGSENLGHSLTYYDTQFLIAVLHLSSIGLLTWSLVFPGILTLPMLFAALAYFASRAVRNSRVFDRIIVYSIILQIAHFLFVAISTSFTQLETSNSKKYVTLLGLRKFEPQFTMNLVQALALGLFCTNIFCKRYIAEALKRGERDASRAGQLNLTEFVHGAAYSAQAKRQRAIYTIFKLFLDCGSLTALYVSAGTKASILNSVFLLSLCVLCLFHAFGGCRRYPKVIYYIWSFILAYSTIFVFITCTACRAIKGFGNGKDDLCNIILVGVRPATRLEVVAYTITVVLSAVQVHFTWYTAPNNQNARDDYASSVWQLIRKYFLFLSYVALLLYPLVHPANFLSYGYVLFLAISIVVELLGPYLRRENRSIRPLIKSYWPTVVMFSVCALAVRYVFRFEELAKSEAHKWARKWMFGYDRTNSTIPEFHFTAGDASILIIVSLQGRFFGLETLIESAFADRRDAEDEDIHAPSTRRGYNLPPGRTGAEGTVLFQQPSDRNVPSNPRMRSASNMLPPPPPQSSYGSVLRTDHGHDESRRLGVTERERIHQFTQKIKNWRMSLPVKQTEKFIESFYSHSLVLVRKSLLHYSFVLEACAILAAAVWLPGFSVFGAVYTLIGCVLLLSEQVVYEPRELSRVSMDSRTSISKGLVMRMLPVILAILSFALMSLQYVYLVAAELSENNLKKITYLVTYFGLQPPAQERESIPLNEPAMLAHVLVFVTAFLQRIAVKWAAKDAKKKLEDEQRNEAFNPYLDPMQSRHALERAVNISDAIPGLSMPSSNPIEASSENQPPGTPGSVPIEFDMGNQTDTVFVGRLADLNISESGTDPMHLRSETLSEMLSVTIPEATAGLAQKASRKLRAIFRKSREFLRELYVLLNPFWLLWGFDLTFMYLVIGGSLTRSFFSVIYLALVMGVSGCRRTKIARHWHHVTLLMAFLVLLQYAMTLGMPNPSIGTKETSSIVEGWDEWLFIDAQNNTFERKYDVTFAFLAVICASMTLNAIAPGPRGFSFWSRKDLTNTRTSEKCYRKKKHDSDDEELDDELEIVKSRKDSSEKGEADDLRRRNSSRGSTSASTTIRKSSDADSEINLPHDFWDRSSRNEDFTVRPLSTRNLIKLYWMRFSGSLVQLYMFAAAVEVTSVFSGVLLLLSFYFLFNFTDVKAKRSSFFIVRFYVLSVVFVLVVYQAPFKALGDWAEVLGLYKTSNGNGAVLLGLMVSLWVICQVQGRIYESESFKYIVKYGEEDAKVRFKRAVHDHNTRKYEMMRGRNKYRRSKLARVQRLERLKNLRFVKDRSVERLYKVCVVDEMKFLRKNAEERKGNAHIFSSHVKTKAVEQEPKESGYRSLLRRFFRGSSWRKYSSNPLSSEFRLFLSRYSAWAVYSTMLLATVVNPTELVAFYPLVLFLYLILEQPRPPRKVWQLLMVLVCAIITGKYVFRELFNCPYVFFGDAKVDDPLECTEKPNCNSDVCRISSGIFFDILVFLALLWHRTVLYNRGLWDLQTSEEDMLLTNKIEGKKVDTPADMVLTELPDHPEEAIHSSITLFRSPTNYSTPYIPKVTPPTSATQQCSDVFEVLRRSRNKLFTIQSLPATVRHRGHLREDSMALRNDLTPAILSAATVPQTAPPPGSTAPREPPPSSSTATMGELNRFFTRRASVKNEPLVEPQPAHPAHHAVEQSLVESRVIPEIPGSSKPSGNLSLFHSSSKSGLVAGVMNHFRKLTKEQEHKAVGDYYIYIFMVDFLSFCVVTFSYSSIFGGSDQQLPWWRANFIEISHLLTLIGMFIALVIDRIVYLTRSMKGKLVLQYCSVIIYHVVIFFLPSRKTNIRSRSMAKVFYLLRCVYFLLSGLQIRVGFPKYTTAQFLLRNYTTPGIILFEIYNFIPFLWLMRTLLDWAVVPTSLEVFQYFRFVDIYIWLYRNRAVNTARGNFQRKLGQLRRWLPRVYQGFGIFLLCSIALFAPFVFFSVLNPFVSERSPTRAAFTVDITVPRGRENMNISHNIFTRTAFIGDKLNNSEIKRIAAGLDLKSNIIRSQSRQETYLTDFGQISDEGWNLPNVSKIALGEALGNVSDGRTAILIYQLTARTSKSRTEVRS